MRIFSFYITVIFGISLSCFHQANARLHKHKQDTTKRIFRRNLDFSGLLGGNNANGFPNSQSAQSQGNLDFSGLLGGNNVNGFPNSQFAQTQGNTVNYGPPGTGPSTYSPPPSGNTPPNLGSLSPALFSSIPATTIPPLPIPAAPQFAIPEIFPKGPPPQIPSAPGISTPGSDEINLPELANLFGQGEA